MAMVITSLVANYLFLIAVFDLSNGEPPWPGASPSSSVDDLDCSPVLQLEAGVMVEDLVFGLSDERPLWLGSTSGRRLMEDPSVRQLVRASPKVFASPRWSPITDRGGRGLPLLEYFRAATVGQTNRGDLIRFASDGGWDGIPRGHGGGGFTVAVQVLDGGGTAVAAQADSADGRKLFGGGVRVPIAVSLHRACWALIGVMGCWTENWVPELLGLRWTFLSKDVEFAEVKELEKEAGMEGESTAPLLKSI